MNRRFVFYVLMSLMPLFLVCEKEMVSVKRTNVTLSAEYVGVTEAWLKLQTHEANCEVQIKRGNKVILRTAEINKDTVVYDSTLLPVHNYTYTLLIQRGKEKWRKVQEVHITTMDTTSHDFQWEVIEFPSPYGSGALYDVAIINENDIWAVGEIYSDSTQPWLPYNAVHWDGSKWELKKIPYYDETGYAWYTPIHSILAFSENDIWFEAGIHWNGEKYISKKININFPSHVNKMWGTSSNDFYIVGNKGLIAHYDGYTWQRIESKTALDIYDIWGSVNAKNSILEILCTGSKHLQDPEFRRVIFKLENNTITELSSHPIHWTLYSVWFIPEHIYYVVGSGVYRKHSLKDKQWHQVQNATQYYSYRIRGVAINDITVVGGFGEIVHFNGASWKSYINQTRLSGNYYSLDMTNDLIVAVGNHGRAGTLTIGRRQ